MFLCDDDDDHYHFSLIDDVHESNYLIHTVLLFVGRKMKVINLEVYIYYIQRGEEEKKAQMNNQSSIDRFPTVNNNTFLFITLAYNRVRVRYERVECQSKKRNGCKRSVPKLKLTDIYTHIHIVYIDSLKEGQ